MAEGAETVQEDSIDFVISNAELTLSTIYNVIANVELEETWIRRERWFLGVMGS